MAPPFFNNVCFFPSAFFLLFFLTTLVLYVYLDLVVSFLALYKIRLATYEHDILDFHITIDDIERFLLCFSLIGPTIRAHVPVVCKSLLFSSSRPKKHQLLFSLRWSDALRQGGRRGGVIVVVILVTSTSSSTNSTGSTSSSSTSRSITSTRSARNNRLLTIISIVLLCYYYFHYYNILTYLF